MNLSKQLCKLLFLGGYSYSYIYLSINISNLIYILIYATLGATWGCRPSVLAHEALKSLLLISNIESRSFFNHAYKALKVCPESRVTFQILLKSEYIPRASKPSANMKKALLKVLAQHQNTAAKFTINLCTNAFVESLPLNIYVRRT